MILQGDLNLLAIQKNFLKKNYVNVTGNVPLHVPDEDDKRVLSLLWENKVQGWWLYKEDLIGHEICTEVEWLEELRAFVERRR